MSNPKRRPRLHFLSDLHLDFSDDDLRFTGNEPMLQDVDALVVAGDISNDREKAYQWFEEYQRAFPNRVMIFIPGNHDYYGSSIQETVKWWQNRDLAKASDMKRLFVLCNDEAAPVVAYPNLLFLGGTYWTSMRNHDEDHQKKGLRCYDFETTKGNPTSGSVTSNRSGNRQVMAYASTMINDYNYILSADSHVRGTSGFICPEDTVREHHKSLEFLRRFIHKEEQTSQTESKLLNIVKCGNKSSKMCDFPTFGITGEQQEHKQDLAASEKTTSTEKQEKKEAFVPLVQANATDAATESIETINTTSLVTTIISPEAEKKPEKQLVVITHHLPSFKSVAARYKNSALNPCFASQTDDLVMQLQPALWIHGHTHASVSYILGKTRVLCNPRGYGAENASFNPMMVVEV